MCGCSPRLEVGGRRTHLRPLLVLTCGDCCPLCTIIPGGPPVEAPRAARQLELIQGGAGTRAPHHVTSPWEQGRVEKCWGLGAGVHGRSGIAIR